MYKIQMRQHRKHNWESLPYDHSDCHSLGDALLIISAYTFSKEHNWKPKTHVRVLGPGDIEALEMIIY